MSDGERPAPQPPEPAPLPPGLASPTGEELLYPAFMAGICAGALSGVPLINVFCCLWMVGGGMLAVYFFYLKTGRGLPSPADGARLGLLTGLFGFLVAFFVNVLSQLLIHRGVQGAMARYREQIQKSPLGSDPQSKELLAWALTPAGTAGLFLTGMIIFFAVFLALSTVGGVLGVRVQSSRSNVQGPP